MTFLARAYMGTWDRSKLTPLDRGRQKALALARQSYETQRRLFGDDDPQTVEATWCLATIYLHTGQFEQCRPLLLHLLEYHKRADGPDALNTTVAIGQMGRFYALQHNYREAEPWLRDLLQWHLAHAGPLNQGTIGAMEDLGSIYLHEGRYWEAEALWSQGLACARRVFGADDFWTADAERNLKFAYSEHQRHPEAGPMFLGGMDGFERFESKLNSILSPARPAAATRPAASPATAPATAARQP
jgi:tetratricopeptide (TPR) repeat protein